MLCTDDELVRECSDRECLNAWRGIFGVSVLRLAMDIVLKDRCSYNESDVAREWTDGIGKDSLERLRFRIASISDGGKIAEIFGLLNAGLGVDSEGIPVVEEWGRSLLLNGIELSLLPATN